MPSPVKESIPSLQLLPTTQLHAPPSPGTHRALRRLQSAHSLGAKAASQPSLISQQRQQLQLQQLSQHQQLHPPSSSSQNPSQHTHHQQGSGSPIRRNANIRSPQRNRSNSDAKATAPVVHQANSMPPTRRSALNKRSAAADGMSLDRLLRDGPPGGDVAGALESARLKILDQGIKSDSDGMVRPALLDIPLLIA